MRNTSAITSDRTVAARSAADPIPLPLVGSSDAARRARQALELAAGRGTPVLLLADRGSRPQVVADWLHSRTRAGTPAVAVDCSSFEPVELDRRLFGSPPRRPPAQDLEAIGLDSALAEAGEGTLFLENIDELPASSQRRLARVLRDGEVRVASRGHAVPLALRLIASSTKDLDAEARDGRFRQDLLRRFASCRVTMPAIRQRPGDLGALIERMVADMGGPPRGFTQPAITVLAALPWQENIDELASVLGKVLSGAGPLVTQEDVLAHLPMDGALRVDLTASLREARRRFEREYIAAVLERHQWRMSEAARALGIERANLYRKTRQLGIVRVPRVEGA